MATERIVQITPALPGFYVRYSEPEGDGTIVAPVAFWALLEDEKGGQRVVGVDVVELGDSWTPDLITNNIEAYFHSHVPLDADGEPLDIK